MPNYAQTAQKIAQAIGRTNIPDEINYPFLYNLLYRRLLVFVPDYVYFWIINLLTRFIPEQKSDFSICAVQVYASNLTENRKIK